MGGGGSSEGPGGEAAVSSGSPAGVRRVGEAAAERRLGWGWQQASLLCAEPRVLRVHNGAADSGPAARPGRRRAALAMEDAPGLCSCEAHPSSLNATVVTTTTTMMITVASVNQDTRERSGSPALF